MWAYPFYIGIGPGGETDIGHVCTVCIGLQHYAAYSPPAQLTMGFITDIGHVQYVQYV